MIHLTNVEVRPAQVQDVKDMYAFMLPYMLDKTLIPRDKDNIYQHLQEFVVAIYEEKVVGVVALHVYTATLAEIRSLVVPSQYQGLGIGAALVKACESLAISMGITCVFALTYVDIFFIKLGFHVVQKESLPQKVWTVCVHCPKFSHCDEIAVQKILSAK